MVNIPTTESNESDHAWQVATLWPIQGHWSEGDFLEATQSTNRMAELVDGFLEVLPMPTLAHQLIVHWICEVFKQFALTHKLGIVASAPLRVRMKAGNIREPDVVFMRTENRHRAGNDIFDGADLVLEVVSDDSKSRQRDYDKKLIEYAAAGIPEYWIVDPQENKITVLTLPAEGEAYAEHGTFTLGQMATSKMLVGFAVDVQAVFDAAKV